MHVIEPIKPIPNFIYRCDSRFHLDIIEEMFEERLKYGFAIIDGSGMLLGTLQGHQRDILFRYQVSLPKKHHKGGQSAARFARLRLEARQNYVTKMVEAVTLNFIDRATSRPNIAGLFLAGNADFKVELQKNLDPRLTPLVNGVFQIQYGGSQGFNEAIEQAAPLLEHLPLLHQKKILTEFFTEIAKDSQLYCYGLLQMISALEQGAVEKLILWDKLPTFRFTIEGLSGSTVRYGTEPNLVEGESVVEAVPLLEWLVEGYNQFGCSLEFVSDATPEGSQFCTGFGGIGGLLRFALQHIEEPFEVEDEDDDSEDFWF